MRMKRLSLCVVMLAVSVTAVGQSGRRIAIVEANGPMARSNAAFALAEARLTDALTAKLAGRPEFTLVDRASIDKILKEQNFQNSDRSSADTAVRIGRLLGVGQIVLVNVFDGSYTTHQDVEGSTTRTTGSVVLRANAKMIDVETGVILSQPTAAFQESVPVSETKRTMGGQFGMIRVPATQKTTGGDPKVIEDNELEKATDAVTSELATKLMGSATTAPALKAAPALVAGIANGSVYINEGTAAGVKAGDRFQVTREVSVGLTDPATGQPIVQKQKVCVLTIVDAQDTNASGTCQGGLPQSKDVASPLQ